MTRIICIVGCSIVAVALLADSSVAARAPSSAAKRAQAATKKPKPVAEQRQPAAEKPEPAAEKPEPKSEPAAKKSQPKPESGAEKKEAAAKPAAPSVAVYTVKPEPFKVDVTLDGVFEAQTMTEIVLRPETWPVFKALEAVEHGASTKKGDLLVQFDSKKIDEAVADGRTAQQLAKLSLEQAEANLRILEASTPLDVALAERQKQMADEDLARFFQIDRQMRQKSAEQSLKWSEQSLEYELEELRQLEQMYKADDLTEETEEIILKRQRNSVEQAKFYLERAKIHYDEALKIDLPRYEEYLKESTRTIQMATDKAKKTLPLELHKQQLELEKTKVQRARDDEKLKKLLADQALMTLKSPVDGVVYYGKCVRGKWSGASSIAEKIRLRSTVSANSVLLTIVSPRPMLIRVAVTEKDLHWIRSGLKGTVQPVSYPDLRAAAVVAEVDAIPASDGKFGALFRVGLDQEAEALMPGMTCKVKLVPYLKKRALTVPASAVKTDEYDDQKHYVHLVSQDGKSRKQPVTIGKKTATKVEIVDGLVAGDRVLKEYPKETK